MPFEMNVQEQILSEEEKRVDNECVVIDMAMIDYLLSFLVCRKALPRDIAEAHVRRVRIPIEDALLGRRIHPDAVYILREKLEKKYVMAQIAAGSSVGIELAQSLGGCQSQSMLNSFHSSGLQKENPGALFAQILNATKLKTTWTRVFLRSRPATIAEARACVLSSLAGVDVKSLVARVSFDTDARAALLPGGGDDWHMIHCALLDRAVDVLDGRPGGRVGLDLSAQKMCDHYIFPRAVCRAIENQYSDVVCVPAPMALRRIDVYVPYPADVAAACDAVKKRFLDAVFWTQALAPVSVCGLRGAGDQTFSVDRGECSVALSNGSFLDILNVPVVDPVRTTSSNMWEIYAALGIEAVRAFLAREISQKVVPGVNKCHVFLLADRMTFCGIKSISRYAVRADEDGSNGSVLSCATFEESMEHIVNGGIFARTDETDTVSASIVCGKRCGAGTGSFDVLVDTVALLRHATAKTTGGAPTGGAPTGGAPTGGAPTEDAGSNGDQHATDEENAADAFCRWNKRPHDPLANTLYG